MQTNCLGDAHSHTRKDIGRVPPTNSAVPVSRPLVAICISKFGRKQEPLEGAGGLCWDLLAERDISEFFFVPRTSILCSTLCTWTLDLRDGWDLSQPEQEAATHLCCSSQDHGCWSLIHCKQTWEVKGYDDLTVSCSMRFASLLLLFLSPWRRGSDDPQRDRRASGCVSYENPQFGQHSLETAAELDCRCHRDGRRSHRYWQGSGRGMCRGLRRQLQTDGVLYEDICLELEQVRHVWPSIFPLSSPEKR